MKRTTEKVLAIISAVFTVAFTILGFIGLGFLKMVTSDPAIRVDFEKELLDFDATLTSADIEVMFESNIFYRYSFDRKRSRSTIKRVCSPSPIRFSPS